MSSAEPETRRDGEPNEELELIKCKATLYRFNRDDHAWKERGSGDIKLLRHEKNNTVRVVMRRDKTFVVCANHFITPETIMKEHGDSGKSFNWSVLAEFADGQMKPELLTIKFTNLQDAALWKKTFLEAQEMLKRGGHTTSNSSTLKVPQITVTTSEDHKYILL